MGKLLPFKSALALACCASIWGCSSLSDHSQNQSYTIEGQVHTPGTTKVLLVKSTEGIGQVIDSASVDSKGNFNIQSKGLASGIYQVWIGEQRLDVLLDTNYISIDAEGKPNGKYIIKSSKGQAILDQFDHVLFDYRLRRSMLDKSSLMEAEKRKKKQEYYAIYSQSTKALLEKAGVSTLGLYLVSKLDVEKDYATMEQFALAFAKKQPGLPEAQQFLSKLKSVQTTIVGQPAADIEAMDQQGVLRKLSDLKGKYVLLDFWASWCGPCRKENPQLVRLYQKYHDKGFEIFSVSIDENKVAWKAAIQDDKLSWTQVSDLKGWEGTAALQYQIEAIPANFLINKDGIVVHKMVESEELEMVLKGLLP